MSRACLLFNWTPKDCLEMPARQFFCVLKGGQKINREEKMEFFYEMTQIAVCAQATDKYIKSLQKFYFDRTYSGPRILPPDNDKIVSRQLIKIFKEAGQNG